MFSFPSKMSQEVFVISQEAGVQLSSQKSIFSEMFEGNIEHVTKNTKNSFLNNIF